MEKADSFSITVSTLALFTQPCRGNGAILPRETFQVRKQVPAAKGRNSPPLRSQRRFSGSESKMFARCHLPLERVLVPALAGITHSDWNTLWFGYMAQTPWRSGYGFSAWSFVPSVSPVPALCR